MLAKHATARTRGHFCASAYMHLYIESKKCTLWVCVYLHARVCHMRRRIHVCHMMRRIHVCLCICMRACACAVVSYMTGVRKPD